MRGEIIKKYSDALNTLNNLKRKQRACPTNKRVVEIEDALEYVWFLKESLFITIEEEEMAVTKKFNK